jgi:hypothetical protein
MSTYKVIKDIGQTLVKLLERYMKNDPGLADESITIADNEIVLASPQDDEASAAKLSLFLYHILASPHTQNRDREVRDRNTLRNPPLALDLNYLVTPMVKETKNKHVLLGKVMEIFHDYPLLKGSVLQGDLKGSDSCFRLTLLSHTLENMTDLWQSIKDKSFMASIIYQVSPVFIDSTREVEIHRAEDTRIVYSQKPKDTKIEEK